MNPTILKFGYPDTLLSEYEHWVVLLRPAQVTLGSLILASRDDAAAFSQLSSASCAELSVVYGQIEGTLKRLFDHDKINYLALMMVDREVHFHVLPRYADKREFQGVQFSDTSWPGPPDLSRTIDTPDPVFRSLRDTLTEHWI